MPKPLRTAQLARIIANLLAPIPPPPLNGGKAGADIKPVDATNALILVVEDNALNQKGILKMLSNLGCRHELAENGIQAVDFATKKDCDLILMDWHMPVRDGIEATKCIRQLGGRHATLPIIAVTASALQNEREQCFDAGMNDYLSKPISEKNLKAILQKWLTLGATVNQAQLSRH